MFTDFNKDKIFISYECIRNIPYMILKLINRSSEIQAIFKDVIDVNKITSLDDNQMKSISLNMRKANILNCVPSLDRFDTKGALESLLKYQYESMVGICIDDENSFFPIKYIINTFLQMEFTQEIYIHSNEQNPFILQDIINTFGENSKIKYIFGNIDTSLDFLNTCSLFILNDYKILKMIEPIIEYKEIILSYLPFNITVKNGDVVPRYDICNENSDKVFNFSLYDPFNKNN